MREIKEQTHLECPVLAEIKPDTSRIEIRIITTLWMDCGLFNDGA
jgi:hypothetical protein